ncbi:hypothetical protein [Sporosarcina globispora]|uniref:hypothetical protein n=1 Tax=Sporosarcina globispora TaxID=1459 RepID=UPI000A98618F|nr:hypothetical protein [Sporosarcina globispora]
MRNFETILNKLTVSENADNKCPYCWEAAAKTNDELYCEECKIKVGECCELI